MNKISSKHFLLFILAVTMISIRSYSSIFINLGGRDSWIISILATIIIGLFFIILLKINVKTNEFDIKIIFDNCGGKAFGTILTFLFSIGLSLICIESTSVEASSVHNCFFLSTPTWYCILFFIIIAGYVISRNINSLIIMVVSIVSLTILGDIIILLSILKYLDLNHLLPILREGLIKNKLLCLVSLVGTLSSISITLPFLKYLHTKKSIMSDSIFALLICGFFISTSLGSIISFFGLERSTNIFFPEYIECQRIKIANFLEFGEIFFIFRSVCMWFLKYILSIHAILILYKDKIKTPNIFIIVYSFFVFVISNYISNNQYILFYNLKYLQYILIVPFIIIPLLAYSCFYFKNRNSKNRL